MDFRHRETGTIYHVTNEGLVSHYETSPLFEKVAPITPKADPTEEPEKLPKTPKKGAKRRKK